MDQGGAAYASENPSESPDPNQAKNDADIIALAKKRFKSAAESEHDNRVLALEDLKFLAGDQWDPQIKKDRETNNRPALVINRLPQHLRQVINEQKQNRPSMRTSPVDDKADVETSKMLNGLLKHIEYDSNADVAYDRAFEWAVRTGLGYMRVVTEYSDSQSFDLCLKIKSIRNRFSAYLDDSSQEPDGSDASWGFVFDDIPKEEFCNTYGESKLSSLKDWSSIGDTNGWVNKDTCRVAEYFYKEQKPTTLYLLSDGSVFTKETLPGDFAARGLSITKERQATVDVVNWLKINGLEILERSVWPGPWIPIVPVQGEELDIDGERVLEGMVRHSKDSQRMYNYQATNEAETIALAPRSPWVGYAGQFEGYEEQWKTANNKNHAFLQVKPISINGQVAPLPQRNVFEPPIQAITQARMMAAEDLKATTGIYDSALGAKSNEISGVAIQRRKTQGATANYHFIDNLRISMRHMGRICLAAIPKVYDTQRILRIIGEDGSEQRIAINGAQPPDGQTKSYDFTTGKYDVTVSSGPSFETKRQEAVESMLSLTQSYPKVAEVAGDLMVKNMDWNGAQEIADRLKKTMPPELVGDATEAQKQIPQAAQNQIAQMNQMIEALTQKLNEANHKIENKTIELESKERIEMQRIQANVEIEMAKMGSKDAQFLMMQEIAQLERRLNLLQQNAPIDSDVNEADPDQAEPTEINEQQPTGGIEPGQSMGEMP